MAKGRTVPPAFTPIHHDGRTEDVDSHRVFIAANAERLLAAAQKAYRSEGRGAFVAYTKDAGSNETEARYLSDQRARTIAGWPSQPAARMVHDYNPEREFVFVIVRSDGGASTYRVGIADGEPVLTISA